MRGHVLVLVLGLFASSGCTSRRGSDPLEPPDAGPPDAARVDAATADAASVDAAEASTRDASRDAAVDPAPIVDALLDVICDARIGASCSAPWECGCPDLGARPALTACAADAVPGCRLFEGGALELSVVSDGVHLDGDALAACRTTLEAAWTSCVPLRFADVPACRHARVSRVALGEPCTGPSLCADGAGLCDEGGICARAPMRGERCETNECAAGLACFGELCGLPRAEGLSCEDHEDCASPSLCVGGRCGSIAGVGESCTGVGSCTVGASCSGGSCEARTPGACTDDAACGDLTSCVIPSVRRCEPTALSGELCTDDASCASGLACDVDAGTCGPLPTLGEACLARCASGLFCDFGECIARAGAGSDCPFDSNACDVGLACNAGVCGAPPGVASRCADDRVCAAGLTCIDESGGPTCEAPHPLGGSCGVATDCAAGLVCIAGTCASPIAVGGECFATDDCEAGLGCTYDEGTGVSRCTAAPLAHELCIDACAPSSRCVDVLDPGGCVPTLCGTLEG